MNEVLQQRLAENPLPRRAFVLMSEPELRLLAFHEAAQGELQRRRARKEAKRSGNLAALRETTPVRPEPKVKDDDLRGTIAALFAASSGRAQP